jgi:hypothetical protein
MVHYNFDGRIQVGEMIVNAQIADDVLFIFQELFRRGYQIRKMHLIDDYWTGEGVSSDEASVTDDNTSCFCFRRASNTDTLSRHALGLAIDLNPLENPFLTFDEDGTMHILPEEGAPYAYDRSPDIPHVITESDDAYILFSEMGFSWGGDWKSFPDMPHIQWDNGGEWTSKMILAGNHPPRMPLAGEKEETEMRYNTVKECPSWAQATIQKLVKKGYLNGNGEGLDLSADMIRLLVILDRAGAFYKEE